LFFNLSKKKDFLRIMQILAQTFIWSSYNF